jgi:hypothetical protein
MVASAILVFSLTNGGICRVVTSCGRGFDLHLLVLTVSGSKVRFELCSGLLDHMLFVQPTTRTHEVASCKDFGVANVDLSRVSNEDASRFKIV